MEPPPPPWGLKVQAVRGLRVCFLMDPGARCCFRNLWSLDCCLRKETGHARAYAHVPTHRHRHKKAYTCTPWVRLRHLSTGPTLTEMR